MKILPRAVLISTLLLTLPATAVRAQDKNDPISAPPPIASFLSEGFGAQHENAPAETTQFGRLAGLWSVEAEMARQSGGWVTTAPGIWAWKYTLGGFAVSDLFYQAADNLPVYMANLGRDYLLTANRIYNVAEKKWRVAWMANGAGSVMGADVGHFTASLSGVDIVMMSTDDGASGTGMQRVVFYEIGQDTFRWRSEYSTDKGKTWVTVMRMLATRL